MATLAFDGLMKDLPIGWTWVHPDVVGVSHEEQLERLTPEQVKTLQVRCQLASNRFAAMEVTDSLGKLSVKAS